MEITPTLLPFQEWTEVLGSERLTGAQLDRLTHHVHNPEMNGDSYRIKQSRRTLKHIPLNAPRGEGPLPPVLGCSGGIPAFLALKNKRPKAWMRISSKADHHSWMNAITIPV
jgi:hypothetical protein